MQKLSRCLSASPRVGAPRTRLSSACTRVLAVLALLGRLPCPPARPCPTRHPSCAVCHRRANTVLCPPQACEFHMPPLCTDTTRKRPQPTPQFERCAKRYCRASAVHAPADVPCACEPCWATCHARLPARPPSCAACATTALLSAVLAPRRRADLRRPAARPPGLPKAAAARRTRGQPTGGQPAGRARQGLGQRPRDGLCCAGPHARRGQGVVVLAQQTQHLGLFRPPYPSPKPFGPLTLPRICGLRRVKEALHE
jgi:hypothetical protein